LSNNIIRTTNNESSSTHLRVPIEPITPNQEPKSLDARNKARMLIIVDSIRVLDKSQSGEEWESWTAPYRDGKLPVAWDERRIGFIKYIEIEQTLLDYRIKTYGLNISVTRIRAWEDLKTNVKQLEYP
jgi:hypothetical protein